MNLPPVSEETFLICMILATATGALIGFAAGYGIKEKRHAAEIESVIRIAKRIETARAETAMKKERAPKGPQCPTKKTIIRPGRPEPHAQVPQPSGKTRRS